LALADLTSLQFLVGGKSCIFWYSDSYFIIYRLATRAKSHILMCGDKTEARRSTWGKGDSQDNRKGDQARKREVGSIDCVHTIAKGVVCVWE
jgi:hypothetical protein